MPSPIRVLFLCTGNSARSVIAEALLSTLGGAAFEVFSAGTHPRGINPFTVKLLTQAGIDSSPFHSQGLDEYLDDEFDYVITVCDDAAEQCPVFPGRAERIHWSLTDPAAVAGDDAIKLAAFQSTWTDMRQRIEVFMAQALPSNSHP